MSSRGIVKDAATGEVMPGATIIVKGTSNGVMADMEGHSEYLLLPGHTSLNAHSLRMMPY
ncbi:MAG: hypothetical protein R2744_00265 [Bacteroidales bacterium]